MDREDKQFEMSLDSMLQRCQDLMKAMSQFLYRIDAEQLSYKDCVDAFASFQGYIHNLLKVVKNSPALANRSVFPIKLVQFDDEGLATLTEGRLKSFNHDSAPVYLRTKLDPEIESRFNIINMKANSINVDQAQKQINSANKIVQNMTELIRNNREESENEFNRNPFPSTTSTADTYALVGAMFNGKGLRPMDKTGQDSLLSSKMAQHNAAVAAQIQQQQQRPAPGKSQPSIKTNIKAANSMHPYNR